MLKELRVAFLAPRNFYFLPRFCAVILVALIAGTSISRAEDPDEAYLVVYNLIQDGDTLSASGKNQEALDKYRQAQLALKRFQQYHAAWKPKLVTARANYLSERVTALTAPGVVTGPSPTVAGAGSASGSQGQPRGHGEVLPPGMSIKLLDAGAEPRKELRLHPKTGDKQTCVMTMKMGMEMKMGETSNPEMKLPGMVMTMDTTVKSVAPEGDITYDSVITDATVSDDQAALPQVADAMKESLKKIKGLTTKGTMSNRGISKGRQVNVPEGVDAQTRQVMDQMKDSLSKVSAPLPQEPVGVGAKWEVKMPLKSGGISMEQIADYQLVSVEEDKLVTKTTLTQRAGSQKVENPAMPGLKMDLTRLTGSGSGESTYDLSKILPLHMTMDALSDAVMAMNSGSQKQEITVKVNINLEMETK